MAERDENEIEIELIDDGSRLPDEERDEAEAKANEGVEFDLDELLGITKISEEDRDSEFFDNLAEDMDESVLASLAADLIDDFEGDVSARKEWLQTYIDGLELLGLKIEKRTEPWSGACGVFHPMLSEALVKFQAETIMETFPAGGPVKTKIIGKETDGKKRAAENVSDDMNFQLTEVMTEYRPEHERLLWGLGLSGNAFKKIYYDPTLGRQVALYVPAEDLVVPYGAANLDTAERVTHVMRKSKNEVRKLQVAGFYRDVDMGEPTKGDLDEIEKKIAENMGFSATTDDRYKILEMHVELDLSDYEESDAEAKDTEKEGIALPYVVTVEKTTQTILAIYRNWAPEDEKRLKREHFVHYPYIPGFGFYAFGLVHLLGSFAKSGTSLIRQLVDAGTLSNLPGGFKTRGMRIKGDDTPISPGEFRDVDVASGTIKDNIMTLPYKEPSQTLYQLLGTIVEEGRKFASTADLKVSDMSSQSPVGTTLAILERTLKVMTSVQARIHYAMKREFRLLAALIRDFTPKEYSYEPDQGGRKAKQADYDMVEVIPVSDPNASTMAQKVVQYQAVMQLAQTAPQMYDMQELHRQMLAALGVKNLNKVLPDKDEAKPEDPVTENMNILMNKPVRAFMYQDHEAHIQTHMAFAQDPKMQELMQNNPNAQAMMAVGAAHIAEHVAFLYRKKIEDQLGVPLPPEGQKLPEDIEVSLSRLVAKASDQLMQKNLAEAQQAQQQQEEKDPLNVIQREELNLRKQELELKAQKEMAAIEIDKAKLELEKAKLVVDTAKVEEETRRKERDLEVKQYIEGAKMGMQAAQSRNNSAPEMIEKEG